MIRLKTSGSFHNTEKICKSAINGNYKNILTHYAEVGVAALSSYTPHNTGKTAESWTYSIEDNGNEFRITWNNSNIINGVNIALILQYGHATKNGGYIEGIDYINPAMAQVFDDLAKAAWEEVGR